MAREIGSRDVRRTVLVYEHSLARGRTAKRGMLSAAVERRTIVAFILPGYSRHPIGGFRVVYQYANYLAANQLADVVLVHDCSGLEYPGRRKLRRVVGNMRDRVRRRLSELLHSQPIDWYPTHEQVEISMSIKGPWRRRIAKGDYIIATAVDTAEVVARICEQSESEGAYFLQHLESWTLGAGYLDLTLRLPLRKAAVAPWIAQHCVALDQECVVVANGLPAGEFAAGPPIGKRTSVMTLIGSDPLKRPDVAVDALNLLSASGLDAVAFGTVDRPKELVEKVRYVRSPSRNDLAAMYHRTRVFFCTSEHEGFGLTPAEAALSGCVIVSTNNGGVESYAARFAIFTGGPNAEATADAVERAYHMGDEATKRVEVGLQSMRSRTTEDAACEFSKWLFSSVSDHRSEARVGLPALGEDEKARRQQ